MQGHPTPMIESSCNLDFDFTGALAGRGWLCLLLLIVNELHGETRPICLSLPTGRAVGDRPETETSDQIVEGNL